MWEAIQALATNPVTLVAVLIIIGLVVYGVITGKISYKAHGLNVGNDDETRELIRNQWEYACSACSSQFYKIRRYCKSDEHCSLLVAKVTDIFQQMAVYNHISKEEDYIKAKQGLVLQCIRTMSDDTHFWSSDFEDCCNKFVRNLINDMWNMKKLHLHD